VFIRAPKFVALGPNVRSLCQLPDGTIVAAQQGPLLAVSFHAELTTDPRLHRYFLALVEGATAGPEPHQAGSAVASP
jgi:5'-phosphate synthase pdxT subunit